MSEQQIKYFWNGIKVNGGKLLKGHYTEQDGVITLYAWHYAGFRGVQGVINNSEIMTDYFESDRVRFDRSSSQWAEVLAAYEKQEKKTIARLEKKTKGNHAHSLLCAQKNLERVEELRAPATPVATQSAQAELLAMLNM
jgi:transketolase|tara:strand:+ start:6065 stop:6481 length:417 start_codon:yes stop_codon:yes gene_type:complete